MRADDDRKQHNSSTKMVFMNNINLTNVVIIMRRGCQSLPMFLPAIGNDRRKEGRKKEGRDLGGLVIRDQSFETTVSSLSSPLTLVFSCLFADAKQTNLFSCCVFKGM